MGKATKLQLQSPVFTEAIPARIRLARGDEKQTHLTGPKPVLSRVQRSIGEIFGWKGSQLQLLPTAAEAESGGLPLTITSDAELGALIRSWRIREERRRIDEVETVLAMVQSAFQSDDSTIHYAGCHALWRMADHAHEHVQVTRSKFEQLGMLLRSPELRVKSLAAVVLWSFTHKMHTLLRLPFHIAVPALIDCLVEDESTAQKLAQVTLPTPRPQRQTFTRMRSLLARAHQLPEAHPDPSPLPEAHPDPSPLPEAHPDRYRMAHRKGLHSGWRSGWWRGVAQQRVLQRRRRRKRRQRSISKMM